MLAATLLEIAAEDGFEKITEIATAKASGITAIAGSGMRAPAETAFVHLLTMFPVATEAVVSLAFVRILEHFVGLVHFLELVLAASIFVHVRVILARKLTIRLLDIACFRVSGNFEYLVVILVFHAVCRAD